MFTKTKEAPERPKTSQDVQQSRLTAQDKNLLQNTFKGKADILLALRNLLLGLHYDPILDSVLAIRGVKEFLGRILLPELDKDIPIGQTIDLWMTVKMDSLESYTLNIKSRAIMLELLQEALGTLEDPTRRIDLSVDVDRPDIEEYLLARNTFIGHVELQLIAIKTIAEQEPETEAEEIKRRFKDSAK